MALAGCDPWPAHYRTGTVPGREHRKGAKVTLANDMQHMARGGGSEAFPAGKCWEITTVRRDDAAAVRTTWVGTWLLAQQWTIDTGYNSNNGYVVTVRPLRWEPFAGWVSAGPAERI